MQRVVIPNAGIMIIKIRTICTAMLLSSSSLFAQPALKPNVHIGFIYPLSTNWIYAGEQTNLLSFHAIAGVSASEQAFCGSGVSNIIRRNANGLIAAGVSNHIGNNANGVQAAGVLNIISRQATGLTAAGFMNITRNSKGLQAAGFGNIAIDNVKGVQVAGFINKADNVNTQIAGFINIAKQVSGTQLSGFINIAESSDYPIGIINIVKNGSKGLGVTIDEALTTTLSFRSGGRILYGILGAGVNLQQNPKTMYALEAGIGAHLPVTQHFRINGEITSTTLADFERGTHFRGSLRVLPAVTIGRKLEIFAGPTINHASFTRDKGKDLIHNYIWSMDRGTHFHGMYFGGLAGVQILL